MNRRCAVRAAPAAALCVCLLAASGPVGAEGDVFIEGWNARSPFVEGDRLWFSGMDREPRTAAWGERVYQARRNRRGAWVARPLRWMREDVHAAIDHHMADPVVVQDTEEDRLLLLFTRLPFDASDPGRCDPRVARCIDGDRFAIGWASSTDGGERWENRGVLVQPRDGGAMRPGAIVLGEELWVYYTDAASEPSLWRWRVSLLGIVPVGPPMRVAYPGEGLGNPDLIRADGRFYLALDRAETGEVFVFESDDGVVFHQPACWRNPVLDLQDAIRGSHIASLEPLEFLAGEGAGTRHRIARHAVAASRIDCALQGDRRASHSAPPASDQISTISHS